MHLPVILKLKKLFGLFKQVVNTFIIRGDLRVYKQTETCRDLFLPLPVNKYLKIGKKLNFWEGTSKIFSWCSIFVFTGIMKFNSLELKRKFSTLIFGSPGDQLFTGELGKITFLGCSLSSFMMWVKSKDLVGP